ncbi:MAG: hypothetical protein AB7O96_13670 [Pseudobdellovibrionaceae bacterium]
MRFLLLAFLLPFSFLASFSVSAQMDTEFYEKSVEGKSKNQNMTLAKQELLNSAIEQAILPLIREMIGESAVNKNKNTISKILKNYGRFVPTLRTSEMKKQDAEYSQTITMKVSRVDLRGLLSENGLLQDSSGAATVVPFVRVEDRLKGQRYSWWLNSQTQNNGEAEKMAKLVENRMTEVFFKNNFLSFRPIRGEWKGFAPGELQTENPRKTELAEFTTQRGGQICVEGDVVMQEVEKDLQLQVRMEAFHAVTGRTVGEVVRTLKFDNKGHGVDLVKVGSALQEVITDLSSQVFEASQRGTLSAESFVLALEGTLSLQQTEAIKEQLKAQIHEIKSIKERRVSYNEKAFEVESSEKIEALADKLKKFSSPGLKLSEPQIVLDKNEIRMSVGI